MAEQSSSKINPVIIRFQYPANAQYPMDVDAQKKAGLIATTNRSIHPFGTSRRNKRKRARGGA